MTSKHVIISAELPEPWNNANTGSNFSLCTSCDGGAVYGIRVNDRYLGQFCYSCMKKIGLTLLDLAGENVQSEDEKKTLDNKK